MQMIINKIFALVKRDKNRVADKITWLVCDVCLCVCMNAASGDKTRITMIQCNLRRLRAGAVLCISVFQPKIIIKIVRILIGFNSATKIAAPFIAHHCRDPVLFGFFIFFFSCMSHYVECHPCCRFNHNARHLNRLVSTTGNTSPV